MVRFKSPRLVHAVRSVSNALDRMPMLRFILRRVLQIIPLLLGITFISFLVMKMAPGDYLSQLRANPQITPETIAQLKQDYGLDKPTMIQYFYWLKNACMGNFGLSLAYKLPVFHLVGIYALNTLLLTVTSLIFSWAVAIPMGIYAATHKNSFWDRFFSLIAFSGISLPGFFVALVALLLAEKSGLFPIGGMESINHSSLSPFGKILDIGKHLILPTLVLGIQELATIIRQMRGNLLDVLNENYIMAARARGLKERIVVTRHAVRNAINPLITLFGYDLSGLLAGAALVEIVMSWPGLGRLLLNAVLSQDLYLAMGSFVMGAVLLILGNLVADILLAVTDPRIKLS
jgi:peptide/nickel transport system permease protein